LLALLFGMGAVCSVTPTLSVNPAESHAQVGATFTINFRVSDVSGLHGWQLELWFDPEILEAVGVSEGDFLKSAGTTLFLGESNINNEAGVVGPIGSVLFVAENGASGSGVLATLTFRAEAEGSSGLVLENTTLLDSEGSSIAHAAENGSFSTSPPQPAPDATWAVLLAVAGLLVGSAGCLLRSKRKLGKRRGRR
jgi:hypothetical protein